MPQNHDYYSQKFLDIQNEPSNIIPQAISPTNKYEDMENKMDPILDADGYFKREFLMDQILNDDEI